MRFLLRFRELSTFLFLALVLIALEGCGSLSVGELQADGAKASAFCTRGGPGGVLGVGPGGILAGAKVDKEFRGGVAIGAACEIAIQAAK